MSFTKVFQFNAKIKAKSYIKICTFMLKTFQMLRMTGSERMLREKNDEI